MLWNLVSIQLPCLTFRQLAVLATSCGLMIFGWHLSAEDSPVQTVGATVEPDAPSKINEAHPLFKPLEVAYQCRKSLDSVTDYKCLFIKREVLRGKMLKTTMNLKFREAPFSVYLKFNDLNAGREVLYVKGQNNGNMLVHEAGIKSVLGTFPIPINGPDAMAENKYPVSSIGLRNMVTTIIKQWEAEGKFGGVTTQKRNGSKVPVTGETCTVYEAIHEPFKQFKFHTTRLWVDDETGVAIGVQQLGFPAKADMEPPIVEEYFYGQLKTNLKLTDADFDTKNPTYAFR